MENIVISKELLIKKLKNLEHYMPSEDNPLLPKFYDFLMGEINALRNILNNCEGYFESEIENKLPQSLIDKLIELQSLQPTVLYEGKSYDLYLIECLIEGAIKGIKDNSNK